MDGEVKGGVGEKIKNAGLEGETRKKNFLGDSLENSAFLFFVFKSKDAVFFSYPVSLHSLLLLLLPSEQKMSVLPNFPLEFLQKMKSEEQKTLPPYQTMPEPAKAVPQKTNPSPSPSPSTCTVRPQIASYLCSKRSTESIVNGAFKSDHDKKPAVDVRQDQSTDISLIKVMMLRLQHDLDDYKNRVTFLENRLLAGEIKTEDSAHQTEVIASGTLSTNPFHKRTKRGRVEKSQMKPRSKRQKECRAGDRGSSTGEGV